MDIFKELVQIGGTAFACAAIVILMLLRGDLVTGRAYTAMEKEKDKQILREQDQLADLWDGVVRPTLAVGTAALDKVEKETTPRARR